MEGYDQAAGAAARGWANMAEHPAFPRAARALAENMLRACDEDGHLCALFKDAGRYIAAMSAAYLALSGDFSLATLKQVCAASGYLSAGRARSLIEFLLHIGYLERAPHRSGHAVYRPTAAFDAAWRRHLQLALAAGELINPRLGWLGERLEMPGCYPLLLGTQVRRLLALTQAHDPYPELRGAFLDHDAGSQILWTLIGAARAPEFPPRDRLEISLAGAARRFGVSRVQVRRVLEDAANRRLISYDGFGEARFLPLGREQLTIFYAGQLSEIIHTGEEVLGELDRRVPSALIGPDCSC